MQKWQLILASGSPRRREIMTERGLDFTIRTKDTEEITKEVLPAEVVKDLSMQKALAVAEDYPLKNSGEEVVTCVIGADTVVAFGEKILGKPSDREDAAAMIKMLQGNVHQVYTGVAIAVVTGQKKCKEPRCICFAEKTDVLVKPMTDEEILEYVATGESDDKAGAYGIQGIFAKYIDAITGDYYNVVGLPIDRLCEELAALGYPLQERTGNENV